MEIFFEETKWGKMKKAFFDNPMNMKDEYALSHNLSEVSKGRSLYKGNCLITKQCITKLCEYVGLGRPSSIKGLKKHSIIFTIGEAECWFNENGAQIVCPEELKYKFKEMAEYMYPSQCISINQEE